MNTGELTLPKVRSKPDGLFLNRLKKELVIVEAKKGKRDFADGTAQTIQYYAQAKNHPEFRNCTVRNCLVTANDEATQGYKAWEELMISAKEFNICIDSLNARWVACV
jgi:hypothetical protein